MSGFIGFAIFGLILHYVSVYVIIKCHGLIMFYARLLEWLLVKYIFIKNFMNNEKQY